MPDRFTNPENAEEATLAALAESEGNVSIDETVAEEPIAAVETPAEEFVLTDESQSVTKTEQEKE